MIIPKGFSPHNSPLQFKGSTSSESDQQTSSTSTESSTTQGAGAGDISVSNGGTVINSLSPQDVGVIDQALSFAGGIVMPIIGDLDDALTGAQQIAENSLQLAGNATQEAISANTSVVNNAINVNSQTATTAEENNASLASNIASNQQLGYSGILENPVFIVGIVAAIGLIVYLGFRK